MRTVGRLLFMAIFLKGGWQQLAEPTPRARRAQEIGWPVTDDVVRASGMAMMLAALALQLGPLRGLAGLWLAFQVPVVTYVGHRFWEYDGRERNQQEIQFMKNLSLAGAALALSQDR